MTLLEDVTNTNKELGKALDNNQENKKERLYLPKLRLSFLVVDDDPMIIDLNVSLFRKHYQNCNLTTATNGKELIGHASKNKYDIIITDYRMPFVNGLQAIEHLREMDILTPAIIITGTPDENVFRVAENPANKVSVLEKPFLFATLTSEIDKYLNL